MVPVYKWRKRKTVEDSKSGVSGAKKSNLTMREQQIICAVRKLTWLSLDDLLPVLKPVIPSLSRSALHRCLQRNGISKMPVTKPVRKKFKDYPPGFLHIDSAVVRIGKKSLKVFVFIDRATNLCD